MGDEESHGAQKRMWKIISAVFIVFSLRIALKRPYSKYLINLARSVITGKSDLGLNDLAIARSIHQELGLRFLCYDRTDEVNKWHLKKIWLKNKLVTPQYVD